MTPQLVELVLLHVKKAYDMTSFEVGHAILPCAEYLLMKLVKCNMFLSLKRLYGTSSESKHWTCNHETASNTLFERNCCCTAGIS